MRLDPHEAGVLPSQMIVGAIKDGWITASDGSSIPDQNIQPASLDLRLGSVAYRLRCSFLPDNEPVEEALRRYKADERAPLRQAGMILEPNRAYLIPLVERLALPDWVRARANPKSSTGRLDIFTRVISDNNFMFDRVPAGYKGPLYLEVISHTFPIRVAPGMALNQLRLIVGNTTLTDDQILELHKETPLLFRNGIARDPSQVLVSDGLLVGLDLGRPGGQEVVGYSAKYDTKVIDLSNVDSYAARSYWDDVLSEPSERGARIVLHPDKFYLLLSLDNIKIPPGYAAEMTAYDPTNGELRTHYAGFFDPGFGYDPYDQEYPGSRAALEVRAHDVPFAVETGQNICKLSFEKMIEAPERLYGDGLRSNYQGQEIALSKHFRRDRREQRPQPVQSATQPSVDLIDVMQPSLFSFDELLLG
jgi:dCTP deaminase